MLGFLTLIFICQLVGEGIVSFANLPIPGPVVGMALLFSGLMIKGSLPDGLNKTAEFLISNLALLFVPAGVGILLHVNVIGTDLLPISISLIASTLLTIAVTAIAMNMLDRSGGHEGVKKEMADD